MEHLLLRGGWSEGRRLEVILAEEVGHVLRVEALGVGALQERLALVRLVRLEERLVPVHHHVR